MALDCPSAECAEGARVFGAVGKDGRVKRFRTALPVDAGFAASARAHGEPEAHMRFAGPCAERECGNWSDGACTLIGKVHDFLATQDLPPEPEGGNAPCPIRGTCRWFAQERFAACATCDYVVRRPGD